MASALLPSGSAIVAIQRNKFGPDKIDQFSHGAGLEGRSTPDLDTLRVRGEELASLLFGANASYILEQCGEAPVIVTHDATASKLPFETLAAGNPLICPAVKAGMSRLLEVAGAAMEAQFARPPKRAPLELLLIVDPADNLPGAVREGGGGQGCVVPSEKRR